MVEEAGAVAHRVDDPHLLVYLEHALAVRALTLGCWDVALEHLEQAEALMHGRCQGVAWERNMVRAGGVIALTMQGRMNALAQLASRWHREALSVGDLYAQLAARLAAAPALLAAHDVEGARERGREVLAHWMRRFPPLGPLLRLEVNALLYSGRPAEAWEHLWRGWPALRRSQYMRAQIGRLDVYMLRARTALALAAEAPRHRKPLLESAALDARLMARELRRDAPVSARIIEAGIAYLEGDPDAAMAHLVASVDGYEACGMGVPAECARRKLGELIRGERGRTLIAHADARMNAEGIASPPHWAALWVPGFEAPAWTRLQPDDAAR
jgi:hypothetical protein